MGALATGRARERMREQTQEDIVFAGFNQYYILVHQTCKTRLLSLFRTRMLRRFSDFPDGSMPLTANRGFSISPD